MKSYLEYRDTLDRLLHESEWGNRKTGLAEKIHSSLNGGAAHALRQTVQGTSIRQFGAFFTGEHLGRQTVQPLARLADVRQLPVCDPTCGSGDLLLRWAEFLPVSKDLIETLNEWEALLFGVDLHSEFLAVAKRRLALLAISRGARHKGRAKPSLDRFFPGLVVGNIFRSQDGMPEGATLIMNPPFTQGAAPRNCTWASGRVSHAALALLTCARNAVPGQRIAAILPDVLRSGRRYERWRAEVETVLPGAKTEIVGRFDEHADVDVFLFRGVVGRRKEGAIDWCASVTGGAATIGSICDVHVGSVVPHRDRKIGPWHPYATVHDLPHWKELKANFSSRRHWTSGVRPPFVAVRRTSSPSDAQRAIGTIVRGKEQVVLENHLVTLRPRDGRVDTCRKVARILQDSRTLSWLNRRIRCRHLTVGALSEIPLLA